MSSSPAVLDVSLHGVLDNESANMALDGIRNGALPDRLEEATSSTSPRTGRAGLRNAPTSGSAS